MAKNGKTGETMATTLLFPAKSVVEKLSKAKRDTRKRVRDINDEFGKKFAKGVDEEHGDRRALNILFNLDSLDDKQLHVTWMHLMKGAEDLGIVARATAQGELFENGEDDDNDNVTKIGAAARKVSEKAGETAKH